MEDDGVATERTAEIGSNGQQTEFAECVLVIADYEGFVGVEVVGGVADGAVGQTGRG